MALENYAELTEKKAAKSGLTRFFESLVLVSTEGAAKVEATIEAASDDLVAQGKGEKTALDVQTIFNQCKATMEDI